MALFLSSFENKIDKKGRVSVPASFRLTLAKEDFQGIVLFRSYKSDCIEGCSFSRMEQLSGALDQMDQFSDDMDDLAATIFADASQISFDGDGRVTLPKDMLDHAGLSDKVVFVGRGSTFQLWSPEAFKAHQEQARQRAKDKGATIRLPQKNTNDGGN